MRVALRVDASAAIGLGHAKRCLALAAALSARGADVCFVVRDLGIDVPGMVAQAGFDVVVLPRPRAPAPPSPLPHGHWAEVDPAVDAQETVRALAARGVAWVVVDHYAFDAAWHRAVAAGSGARLAVVDDVADRALHGEVLVDHNHCEDHRSKYAGRVPSTMKILGGSRYALLGPAYATAPRYRFRPDVHSVGIFMGGADAGGYCATAWRACRDAARFEGPIEVVTTRNSPRWQELEAALAHDPRTRLSFDLPSLHEFFAGHDLQVGAGGGATWERCCIGVPTLAAPVASNQSAVLEPLKALGVLHVCAATAASLGDGVNLLLARPDLRRDLSDRSRQLIDGRGAGRVADFLLEP